MTINLKKLYSTAAKDVKAAQKNHESSILIPLVAAVAFLEMTDSYIVENKLCFVDPSDVLELRDRPWIDDSTFTIQGEKHD